MKINKMRNELYDNIKNSSFNTPHQKKNKPINEKKHKIVIMKKIKPLFNILKSWKLKKIEIIKPAIKNNKDLKNEWKVNNNKPQNIKLNDKKKKI